MKNFDKSLIAVLFFTFVLGLLYFYGSHLEEIKVAQRKEAIAMLPNAFENTTLYATSALVKDATTGAILYSRHPNKVHSIASLTKLMSTSIILEHLSPQDTIEIPFTALTLSGDNGLFADEKWNVAELLKYSLIGSSNDGIMALAIATEQKIGNETENPLDASPFISLMNDEAKSLGLTSLRFETPTGLDTTEKVPTTWGSAKDIGELLHIIYNKHPDILAATTTSSFTTTSIDGFSHTILNTNPITENIPNILASKTGFTDASGGNLAILTEPIPGHQLEIVVLGSTYEGRFEDILQLAERGKTALENLNTSGLLSNEEYLETIR
jgi:D-alanyl-D-alanine carboxypeptidase